MHIRNRFINFILFAIAISNNINAQITPTSENELLSYYERNIDKLDPIEESYILDVCSMEGNEEDE